MAKATRNLLILLCMLVSSFLTAGLLVGLKAWLHYDLYSFIARAILPVGAIVAGVVAGVLLFIAAHVIGYRPPPRLVWLIPLVALATHLFYLFLDYSVTRVYDISLRQFMSFPDYIRFYAMSWQWGKAARHSTIVEGAFLQGLQVIGFAAAEMLLYSTLASMPSCKRCSGLLSTKVETGRYAEREGAQDIADDIAEDIEEGRLQSAVTRFPDFGETKDSPQARLRANMTVNVCSKCQQSVVAFRLSERDGELWRGMDDYCVENTTEEKLFLDRSS
jgi:hypothetical protein